MICRAFVLFSVLTVPTAFAPPRAEPAPRSRRKPAKSLQIYVVDTEGGKAALWISPTGETLLIDSGNPGGRDTDRIMAAIQDAGVTKIDYLLTTHYHVDHVGGMQELVGRIPVGTFVDHGPTVEGPVNPNLREQVPGFQAWYAERVRAKPSTSSSNPETSCRSRASTWRIVTSAGQGLKTALTGAGRPNPGCAETQPREITGDPENGQSVGSLVTFGEFRAIDLGDLLWNNEIDLMCPTNKVGTRGSLHGVAPRHESVRIAGAGARPSAAGRRDAERHPERRRARRDGDDANDVEHRGHLAAALVLHGRHRTEQRRRVRRQR